MLDFISTVGGGVNWATVLGSAGAGALSFLVRPKALFALLVALTALRPESPIHKRYLHALAIVHGAQPADPPTETPSLKKKKKRGK